EIVASRSVTRWLSRASTTPAGIARSDRIPQTSDHPARGFGLLFDGGPSNSCRRDRPSDHTDYGDQRDHVGERLDEHVVLVAVALDAVRQTAEEAEEEREREGAARPPVAGDQGREADEPATVRHVLGEGVRVAD